ncbi:hypothetical protein MDAP_001350 [Mitosporidium daphniae]
MNVLNIVFTRFVQVGRVVVLKDGPKANSPAVIVEIVDQNRVLIDGPLSGVHRQVVSLRHITLTGIVAKIPRAARTSSVKKALEKSKIMETFQSTSVAKKAALKMRRSTLTDFERFKVMVLKHQKRAILTGGNKPVCKK